MAETTVHTRFPPDILSLRQKAMGNNGIHTLYPLGQDHTVVYAAFTPYENFIARVFGYIRNFSGNYEWSMYTNASGAYAIMKFSRQKPYALLAPAAGRSFDKTGNVSLSPGDFYSVAIRTATDRTYGQSHVAMFMEQSLEAVAFSWSGAKIANYNGQGGCVQLSTHFCDNDASAGFPVNEGLHQNLPSFVRLDLGTYLLYTGIYQGSGPIRLYRPRGAVPDLKNPSQTGIIVRVGIRVTLESFVLTTDYGSTPVVASFKELVQSGYNYIPRFESNFNVRHVLIESTKYTM
ncbi:uncharacterized protein LOC144130061 isoform X2 [Amblyomma americanum]